MNKTGSATKIFLAQTCAFQGMGQGQFRIGGVVDTIDVVEIPDPGFVHVVKQAQEHGSGDVGSGPAGQNIFVCSILFCIN